VLVRFSMTAAKFVDGTIVLLCVLMPAVLLGALFAEVILVLVDPPARAGASGGRPRARPSAAPVAALPGSSGERASEAPRGPRVCLGQPPLR
jgi:hypothetical protein